MTASNIPTKRNSVNQPLDATVHPAGLRDALNVLDNVFESGPNPEGAYFTDCPVCRVTRLLVAWRNNRLFVECFDACDVSKIRRAIRDRQNKKPDTADGRPVKERVTTVDAPGKVSSSNSPISFSELGARLRAAKPPAPYSCVSPDFDAIPVRLKRRAQWVMWQALWDARQKKWTKVPFQVSGAYGSSTNPNTWTTFEHAHTAYRDDAWAGVGYVLTKNDKLVGIDLDHVIENGVVDEWAIKLVRILKTYTEISPSGTGLRLFLFAHLPAVSKHKRLGLGEHGAGAFEVYDRGRYLTITGKGLAGVKAFRRIPLSRIERRQPELDAVLQMFFPSPRSLLLLRYQDPR